MSVHLLLGQATLIVDEKGSTKIDFNKFARRLFREKTKIFYNIGTLNVTGSKVSILNQYSYFFFYFY